MSSLRRYLAPGRARPNPGFPVEWRHAEGGPWLAMADAGSLEDAASELASPVVSLTLGDLARVRDPKGTVVGFSVMTSEGLVALPPGGDRPLQWAMRTEEMARSHRASGHDWERAWEGSERADWLLYLAGWAGVDRRLLVLAACDCAETALCYVPPGEDRPRQAIEAARRWARGEVTLQEVLATREAARDVARAAARDAAASAARDPVAQYLGPRTAWAMAAAAGAAWAAADAAVETAEVARKAARAAEEAAIAAIWATRAPNDASFASMAPLVRRHLPLWQVALALAIRYQTLA